MNLEWSTKKVRVGDLKLLDINPRKISEEKKSKLIDSLNKFNLVEIPAINVDNTVIGGNQRVTALMLLEREDEEIDVRYPNRKLTDKELKEYAIISNTHAGEFDIDILKSEFGDIDFDALGFELEGITHSGLADMQTEDAKDDNYEIPKIDELKTDVVAGDLIEIGRHRLLCGDSTLVDNFEKLMGGQKADLVITDPPYNVGYEGKTKKKLKIKNDKMDNDSFLAFLSSVFLNLFLNSKSSVAYYVWFPDGEAVNFRTALINTGIDIKQTLVWVKSHFVVGWADYHTKHEPCLYAKNRGEKTNWYSDRAQTSVLNFDKPMANKEHPTMKPVPLIAYLITNSSKTDDLVIDPFLGSGTTMIASHQLNRICYGLELDPKYCQVIINRMLAFDETLKVKINGVEYKK